MKKFQKSKIAALILASGLCLPLMAVGASAVTITEAQPVSKGLYVLAEQNSMAKAALVGSEMKLLRDDFARAVNLSKIDSITVTRVPSADEGELRVGNTLLSGGETVKATDATMLTYVGSGECGVSSFDFKVNDSPVEITCKLYFLSSVNGSPVFDGGDKVYLDVSTYENVSVYGRLPCYDPEGDETVIEIVSYPETGILTLSDSTTGDYVYTPAKDRTGKAEFRYVARDKYGNYSAARTVTLTVERSKTALTFTDMQGSTAHSAAIRVTEEGIMNATVVDGKTYFNPMDKVSREDFVVMAMKALGMKKVTATDKTVFADDKEISDEARNHIATAYELGYIKGERDAQGRLCFSPKRAITRAEAACVLTGMIEAATPTVSVTFADGEYVPTWAESSLYSLSYMGIMHSDGGNIAALDAVTRADAARILVALMKT